LIGGVATRASADEIWVAPTSQADVGGLGIASNVFWPVTPIGVVRFAWGVPGNLQTLQTAKVVLIPHAPGGAATLNLFVCPAESGDPVSGGCVGPIAQPFNGVANQLLEVDVSAALGPHLGIPGQTSLAVVAFTTPTTATDHIVGLRFTYAPKFGATIFTGTQTINGGNLDLDALTGKVTLDGVSFLHNGTAGGGGGNTFLGLNAGTSIPAGSFNTGIGEGALQAPLTGALNTAVGYQALHRVTKSRNTAIGANALAAASDSSDNTAVGNGALSQLASDWDRNTALGAGAGSAVTGGYDNLFLDNPGVPGDGATIRIGRTNGFAHLHTYIAGIRGATTVNADAIPVVIDSAGQLGTISSSARFKEDIHDMAGTSRRLFDLRPVTFRYTRPVGDGSKPIQFGLIAEEVAEAFPELAVRDAAGNVETVHYETLSVLLLNELKKEHDEVQQQKQRIDLLEQRLNDVLSEQPTDRGARR
jgi:hypothetical protein